MDDQPTLPQLDIKSPIFTPRPGWGGKLKKWFKNNWYTYILPAIATAILTVGIFRVLFN